MVVAQSRDILAWPGGGGGGSYTRPVPGAATVPEAQGEIQYGADVKRYQKNAGAQDALPASDYLHQSLSALMNVLKLAGTPVRIRYLEHRNAMVNAVDLYHAAKVQTYCSQVSTSTTMSVRYLLLRLTAVFVHVPVGRRRNVFGQDHRSYASAKRCPFGLP
jgi:hypothetical protein